MAAAVALGLLGFPGSELCFDPLDEVVSQERGEGLGEIGSDDTILGEVELLEDGLVEQPSYFVPPTW